MKDFDKISPFLMRTIIKKFKKYGRSFIDSYGFKSDYKHMLDKAIKVKFLNVCFIGVKDSVGGMGDYQIELTDEAVTYIEYKLL